MPRPVKAEQDAETEAVADAVADADAEQAVDPTNEDGDEAAVAAGAVESVPAEDPARATASTDSGFAAETWASYQTQNQERLQSAVRRVLRDEPQRIVLAGIGLGATQMGEAVRAGRFRPSAIVLLDPATLPGSLISAPPAAEDEDGTAPARDLPWPLTRSAAFTRPALTVFWQSDRAAPSSGMGRWLSSTTPISLAYADPGRVAGRIRGWLRRRLGAG